MAFIKTVPEEQAEGLLQEWYQKEKQTYSYVPNFAQAFSLNPEAYDGWKKLVAAVRGRMRLRRFELVTFASSMALRCTY